MEEENIKLKLSPIERHERIFEIYTLEVKFLECETIGELEKKINKTYEKIELPYSLGIQRKEGLCLATIVFLKKRS